MDTYGITSNEKNWPPNFWEVIIVKEKKEPDACESKKCLDVGHTVAVHALYARYQGWRTAGRLSSLWGGGGGL